MTVEIEIETATKTATTSATVTLPILVRVKTINPTTKTIHARIPIIKWTNKVTLSPMI